MWAACMPPIGLVGHAARQLAAACRALHYMPSLQQFAAIEELADGILRGCRLSVSRGVTLTESSRLDHQLQAAKLLRELQKRLAERRESSGLSSSGSNSTASLLPLGAAPLRIGISGPPGAGKSSLIETLGCALVEEGERVAVLAIDPSSQASGGAILGDKTRMPRLSASLEAYVRPSPARGTLGGVARATFDAILICEAAGYSKVLVETVGVGQSETAVQDLVDIFVLVLPPVGGDELQVIKRGVTEMADIVVINKADGSTEAAAARAAAAFRSTLSFHRKRRQSWQPTVLTCSAHTGLHVDKLLQQLAEYQAAMQGSGELARLRRHQRQRVAWTAAEEAVLDAFRQSANVRWLLGQMTPDIASGALPPRTAAELLAAYNAMYD